MSLKAAAARTRDKQLYPLLSVFIRVHPWLQKSWR